MRTLVVRFILLALICVMTLPAQRLIVESDTIEGRMLQQIDAETDGARKQQLLEEFATRFPNHEAVTWVLSHLQSAAAERKEQALVVELATRILSLDPNDVAAAHNALKAVELRKDVDLVKRWSGLTTAMARRVIRSDQPDDPEELADWKARVEFSKQVELYCEYSLYFAALNAKDSRTKSDLVAVLEQRNPKSEYLAQMRTSQSAVALQVDIEEAVRSAEESFAKGEYTPELLFMTSTYYMQKRINPEKVISYGLRLLETVDQMVKPVDKTDAEWDARKQQIIGQTHWMVGLLFGAQEKFSEADKHLRESLNYIKDNDMIAGALYHLGYVNYRIAEAGERIRIHDAVRFTSECAKLPSAVQAQAEQNLKSMRAEYALPDPQ